MPFDLAETLRSWRHHLHANPELSRREAATAAFVRDRLTELGVAHEGDIGGHGVVATISRGASGRAVGLRAADPGDHRGGLCVENARRDACLRA
jgi:hippurate hydrolase